MTPGHVCGELPSCPAAVTVLPILHIFQWSFMLVSCHRITQAEGLGQGRRLINPWEARGGLHLSISISISISISMDFTFL